MVVHYHFLKFLIVFSAFSIGLFGNINLILIYLRSKQMRSKSGSLIFLNAIIHSICLIFQPLNATILLGFNDVDPMVCSIMSSVYIIGLSLAGTVTIMMAFDLLLNMLFPFRYRLMTPKTFSLIIFPNLTLPILFCFFAFTKGDAFIMWFENRNVSHIHQPTLETCDEQYELKEDLRLWFIGKNVLLTVTAIIYIFCIVMLKIGIGLNKQTAKQIIKCTTVIVCCFVIACMFHVTCTIVLLLSDMEPETKKEFMNFSRLHMALCLSYNFYICIWRSSKLRAVFIDNMRCLMFWSRVRALRKESKAMATSQSTHSNQSNTTTSAIKTPKKVTVVQW